jgi:TonB family protein
MPRMPLLDPEWDRDFTVGVGVSAVLHLTAAIGILYLAAHAPRSATPLESYTVELTDPTALGGRLAFGPLDRPLGRPKRIADASGGAPPGAPNAGETAPAKVVELPKAAVPPQPPKPAVPPKPVEPQKALEPVEPVEPPKPVDAAKAVEPVQPPPKPVEPARPAAPPAPAEPEVKLPDKPKPPENAKPPEPVAEPKPPAPAPEVKPAPAPKPPPVAAPVPATPLPPVQAAKPEPLVEAKPPEPPQPAIRPANPSKPGASESVSAPPAVPKPLASKGPGGAPDGARRVETRPADVTPAPGVGGVKKPQPANVASGDGGTGNGGSPDAPAGDEYAAAAERWRSRLAGGMGGMDGAQSEHGTVGDGTNDAGGGGTVVGFEFLSYRQRVFNTIKSNWANAVRHPGLIAAVRFEIQTDGGVSNVELVRSSGDKAYDQSVVRAVQRSSPLPPPPERYRDEFREVVIDFHSEEEGGRGSG